MSKTDRCIYSREDCFAYGLYGRCYACDDTDFSGNTCPFYKTREERYKEHQATVTRLKDANRHDLIKKYGEEDRQKYVWREIEDV